MALTVNGGPPTEAYTGIKVDACTGTASEVCPTKTCTPAELASCRVTGLAAGTAYQLTAVLVKGTTVVSEQSTPAVAASTVQYL